MSGVYAPVAELRFVLRTVAVTHAGDNVVKQVRILQQGWRDINGGKIEWIDVPCVEEEKVKP